jgi:hypothetical protein
VKFLVDLPLVIPVVFLTFVFELLAEKEANTKKMNIIKIEYPFPTCFEGGG